MLKYALFFCSLLLLTACQPNTSTNNKATPVTNLKNLPSAYWGKWKNKTYYDSLSLTHSPRSVGYASCAILKIDTSAQNQISVIDSQHDAQATTIEQQTDGTIRINTKKSTLKITENQQNLLWHDETQNRDYVFEPMPTVCLYDDNPLRYQVIARCPLNEAVFYGWYYQLNQQNQKTDKLVVFNNGGAVRGLNPNIDMYRICVDEKCRKLSQTDLVWFTEPNTHTAIDSTNYSRYYTWAFKADTLKLYTTKNIGTTTQPNLIQDKPYASLLRKK